MVAIPLNSGAYEAMALIANAQRAVNVFAETNPKDTAPNMPTTQYARPGLLTLAGAGPPGGQPDAQAQARRGPQTAAAGRCLYRSSRGVADPDGDLYAVVDHDVYFIDPDYNYNLIGTIQQAPLSQVSTEALTPVSMSDNGTTIAVVDGTPNGYLIDIKTHGFSRYTDPNFLGSTRADFLDTFLLFNIPGTNQWYITPSLETSPLDPDAVGIKTAWSDNVTVVIAVQRLAYVLGPEKGEVWYNAGAFPFDFDITPGVIIEWGIQAPYSACKIDAFAYWLASAPEGGYIAVKGGSQYAAQRISNHAIEAEWKTYPRVDDCVGSVYQIAGHVFVRFSFPTADKTWTFDAQTEQWFEDLSIDQNGAFHRARNAFCAFCYGRNLGLDYSNGSLYDISLAHRTDGGQAIPWIRSFPHVVNEMKYVSHPYFMADVQGGTVSDTTELKKPVPRALPRGLLPVTQAPAGVPNPAIPAVTRPSGPEIITTPLVHFRMSKDGGGSFGKVRSKRNLSAGKYRPPIRWRNLGVARDAVFELSSTAQQCPALNGGWIDPVPSQV